MVEDVPSRTSHTGEGNTIRPPKAPLSPTKIFIVPLLLLVVLLVAGASTLTLAGSTRSVQGVAKSGCASSAVPFSLRNLCRDQSAVVIDPSTSATYDFFVQAVDRNGGITATHPMPVAIEGTLVSIANSVEACGPPSGNGGCFPGDQGSESTP